MGLPPGGLEGVVPPPNLGPTGPAAPATPNLGIQAESLSKIQQAVQLLSLTLPGLPVGGDEQKAVMDSIKKLSEIAPADMAPQGVAISSIDKLKSDAVQSAFLRKLLESGGGGMGGGGAAPQPGGPPGTLPGMV